MKERGRSGGENYESEKEKMGMKEEWKTDGAKDAVGVEDREEKDRVKKEEWKRKSGRSVREGRGGEKKAVYK